MATISVMLVDDDKVLTYCIQKVLNDEEDIRVEWTAHSVAGAKTILGSLWEAADNLPHVFLIDYMFNDQKGGDGISLAKWMLEHDPRARIILFSMKEGDNLQGCLEVEGFYGYVRKEYGYEDLLDTIRRVAAGEKVWHSRVTL